MVSRVTPGKNSTPEAYDLAVVGAGIAGLNALNAATDYLHKGARCVLIDQKDTAGGMWNTAYDYVRLHQPHEMFTVGDMRWNWTKPRDYLAAGDEVQAHLASALTSIKSRVTLETLFSQTVTQCDEVETGQGPRAELILHPNGAPQAQQRILAKQAIYASGLNYQIAKPLDCSSKRVLSISPQDLLPALAAHSTSPVIIVGGGKTGMDAVLATLEADPTRRVSLIKGRGTNFLNRTQLLPTGLKRWTTGTLPSRLFRSLATRFDGDNEEELMAYVRQQLSTDPAGDNACFLYGFQSEEEHARVYDGLAATYPGYLSDMIDAPDGLRLVMRDGTQIPTAPDPIVVNCTGSFFRAEAMSAPRPILTKNDCVLSLTPRDAFHFLPSVSGFLAPHLFFRSALRKTGFYTADLEALFAKDRQACTGASASLAYLNQVVSLQMLPMSVLNRCGLDMDRWYPLHRRLAALIDIKRHAKTDVAHCRKTLDRLAERFDVPLTPLM